MACRIAIMQPYIFPYIGYFNLINSCDKFVFYDDVNFIKKGWINRNCIISKNELCRFNIPLKKISQNKKINEIIIAEDQNYINDFRKTLIYSYSRAKYFERTMKYVDKIINSEYNHISELAEYSIKELYKLINIKKDFYTSSKQISLPKVLNGEERIIRIVKELGGTIYINSINGSSLYNKDNFKKNNIELKFIKPLIIKYDQFAKEFKPNVSIIDVMMNNSCSKIKEMMNSYILY